MDINTGNHFTIQDVLFASKEDFKVWFAVENVALASNMGRKQMSQKCGLLSGVRPHVWADV